MHPVHDIDALLLLAMALASKRRAAELFEIMAALDLIHGAIPSEGKLGEAFRRLSVNGLIDEVDGRFTLGPGAQKIVAGLPRKADTAERIFGVKAELSAHVAQGEKAPCVPTVEQLSAAIAAHRAAGQGAGQNLLMPKPKVVETEHKRPGHWRKPTGARRRG
ncbi:MAG TPA: hypothetical protein VJ673_21295 [Aromatoleum sp.]|uniref:hypothetical protein n=1 Tax=Aromatoleum sp. TaxID=2307007 RepID=UPI002B499D7B|nr:hypothetical protein [Aromatoleum sp.]HJV28226.1 hypothetical protein [Aromatoleum sp.]